MPNLDPEPAPVPPHPPLRGYYGTDENRHRYVIDLFNRTARHYNTIEGIFFGGGLLYRRLSLRFNGLKRGMKVLDVAIGTAAVSRGATKIVGPEGLVIGVDPSPGMIAEARKNFSGPISRGIGEQLPFATGAFDFVTMGIALRHVADLRAAIGEYFRVLKPGGTVWILDSHVPKSPLGHAATRFVWANLVPRLTMLTTKDAKAKELMDFYWDTIDQSVEPETIVSVMKDVGFEQARAKIVMPGAFCEYVGRKPAG